MADDEKELRGWEHRLPALDAEWNYWWIEGDGALLAVIGADDLRSALAIVHDHRTRGASITAWVAKVDSLGDVVRDPKRNWAIATKKAR
ncbi:MAG TPA: hypothetical protein VGY54_05955 [Polyangiaceae bacterium]|jgi:hypothetical protein|nr:hypothetical protein [Polyangiaceae bacterium]